MLLANRLTLLSQTYIAVEKSQSRQWFVQLATNEIALHTATKNCCCQALQTLERLNL